MKLRILAFCESTNYDSFEMSVIKHIESLSLNKFEIRVVITIPSIKNIRVNSDVNSLVNLWNSELALTDAILICYSGYQNVSDRHCNYIDSLACYSRIKQKPLIIVIQSCASFSDFHGVIQKCATFNIMSSSGNYLYESHLRGQEPNLKNITPDSAKEIEWHLLKTFSSLKENRSLKLQELYIS